MFVWRRTKTGKDTLLWIVQYGQYPAACCRARAFALHDVSPQPFLSCMSVRCVLGNGLIQCYCKHHSANVEDVRAYDYSNSCGEGRPLALAC